MGSSTATVPPPDWNGETEMTQEELEVAQVLCMLPKLILDLERRSHPGYVHGLPKFLRWGHRRPRSLLHNDTAGHSHPPPPPPEPLQPPPPLQGEEKAGGASKTSSPPSPFQFPGSGCEEDHDSRPAKLPKKHAKSKKDYKERAEELKNKMASLTEDTVDLQRAIEEQKKVLKNLSEESFLLRDAERVHQARLRGSMIPSPTVASPLGAVAGQVVRLTPSFVDPTYLQHKRSEEQTGDGRLPNARGDVIPEVAYFGSSPPAAASGQRGFLFDLNVASEEMAELAASPPPPSLSLPTLTQQKSAVPLRPSQPQPPQQPLLLPSPPPPLMPSEWNHHHQQQLRQEKAAKSAESRKRRREIQREKRSSMASAAAGPSVVSKLPLRLR